MKYLLTHCLLISSCFLFAQTSLEKIDLQMGTYSVGFEHYTALDSSRTYQRDMDWTNQHQARPIPISIWYPAQEARSTSNPLTVLNYMQILKEEEEWEYLPDEHILNWFYYANTPANQAHMLESGKAYKDLPAAKGQFPIVIYAPSFEASSIENFALCELLASHGYVVISSPCRGTESRWLRGRTSKNIETQARDMSFLKTEILKRSFANPEKIAVMGFSFGGMSNVLYQVQDEEIDAIVSLDGSIRYNYPAIKASPYFQIDKVDIPFIHLAQKEIPEVVLKADNIDPKLNTEFPFYDELQNSEAYQLRFHDLTHHHFSTLGVLFQTRDPRQDKTDDKIMASHRLACAYTLQFLNAYIKEDTEAISFLSKTPDQLGLSEELLSIKRKKGSEKTFTPRHFNELAAQQDYQNLTELYQQQKEKYPAFEIPQGMLNTVGLQLVFNPQKAKQGISVLEFGVNLYPESANLFDSLAEAYLFLGEKEKAKKAFTKSLELDPQNQNASKRLLELKR